MPKLNTTIDNLELKSNRVFGAMPDAAWTDEQYPSAKTLYNTYESLHNDFSGVSGRCSTLESTTGGLTGTCNTLSSRCDGLDGRCNTLSSRCDNIDQNCSNLWASYNNVINIAHPVGSIMITASNYNPANYIGGSWTLIDKGFADISGNLSAANWTAGAANLADGNSLFLVKDHMISIRLNLTNSSALTDTASTLGTLNLGSLGITSLAHAVVSDVTASDGGQCTISYNITTGGTITSTDILGVDGKHNMAAGNTFSIHIMQAISHPEMLDAYCNKFYWQRVG